MQTSVMKPSIRSIIGPGIPLWRAAPLHHEHQPSHSMQTSMMEHQLGQVFHTGPLAQALHTGALHRCIMSISWASRWGQVRSGVSIISWFHSKGVRTFVPCILKTTAVVENMLGRRGFDGTEPAAAAVDVDIQCVDTQKVPDTSLLRNRVPKSRMHLGNLAQPLPN